MKKLILLLLFIPLVSFSQKDIKDAIEICTAFSNFESLDEANVVLERILEVSGLSKNFALFPCDAVSNAAAFTLNGDRYIFYNKDFMNKMSLQTNNLSNIFILAHEVGHHVNFHTKDLLLITNGDIPKLSEKRRLELEADEFAAFVMAKMGYTLFDIKSSIKNLDKDWRNSEEEDDTNSTHPSAFKRLQAMNTGFFRVLKQEGIESLTTLELADLADSKFKSGDFWSARSYYYQAQERLWIPYGDFMIGRCEYELKNYTQAVKMFDSAIKGKNDNGWYYYNRAEAKTKIGDSGACDDYSYAYKYADNGWKTEDVEEVKNYLLKIINACN